ALHLAHLQSVSVRYPRQQRLRACGFWATAVKFQLSEPQVGVLLPGDVITNLRRDACILCQPFIRQGVSALVRVPNALLHPISSPMAYTFCAIRGTGHAAKTQVAATHCAACVAHNLAVDTYSPACWIIACVGPCYVQSTDV